MNREVISDKQGVILIMAFIIGETSMETLGLQAKQNLWIVIILSIFMGFPVMLIYARLHYLFPNKDLFDIIEVCLGKFIGKVIMLLFIWYMYDVTSNIVKNLSCFTITVTLNNTPMLIPIIVYMLLCAGIVKAGFDVIVRWTEFFLPIVTFFIIIMVILVIPKMNFYNILPLLFFDDKKAILIGSFVTLAFPFGEAVAFTMFFSSFKTKKSPYKVYILGLLLSGIIVFAISVTNLLVLGEHTVSGIYYTSYESAKYIDILKRSEIIIGSVLILGGFIKISITLSATCKGIVKVFRCKNYKFIVTFVAILVIATSYLTFDSIIVAKEFGAEIYPYYSFLFFVILPIIILIVAEIKKKEISK